MPGFALHRAGRDAKLARAYAQPDEVGMRAKPIFTYSLLAGALALPGHLVRWVR